MSFDAVPQSFVARLRNGFLWLLICVKTQPPSKHQNAINVCLSITSRTQTKFYRYQAGNCDPYNGIFNALFIYFVILLIERIARVVLFQVQLLRFLSTIFFFFKT